VVWSGQPQRQGKGTVVPQIAVSGCCCCCCCCCCCRRLSSREELAGRGGDHRNRLVLQSINGSDVCRKEPLLLFFFRERQAFPRNNGIGPKTTQAGRQGGAVKAEAEGEGREALSKQKEERRGGEERELYGCYDTGYVSVRRLGRGVCALFMTVGALFVGWAAGLEFE
jgi:hypothetical protein